MDHLMESHCKEENEFFKKSYVASLIKLFEKVCPIWEFSI